MKTDRLGSALAGLMTSVAALTAAAQPPPVTSEFKLVWGDEFEHDGAPNPANWTYERGFVRNQELQWYQPENAHVEHGLLVIEARREHVVNQAFDATSSDWQRSRPSAEYTSASLTTRGLHSFQYGRFEMRARIDTRPGNCSLRRCNFLPVRSVITLFLLV